MTIEEKAKAYDMALAWMRELYPGLHGATKEDAEHYFPELRESESEDERMIRKIESFLSAYDAYYFKNDEWREIEVWLEKKKDINCLACDQHLKGYIAGRKVTEEEMQKENTEGDFARGYDCGYECCLNSHGAEWFEKQKEQMLKEAVEGEVKHVATVHYVLTNEDQLTARLKQFQDGEKVRIIVLPKED